MSFFAKCSGKIIDFLKDFLLLKIKIIEKG
jgi:hypothetical protein